MQIFPFFVLNFHKDKIKSHLINVATVRDVPCDVYIGKGKFKKKEKKSKEVQTHPELSWVGPESRPKQCPRTSQHHKADIQQQVSGRKSNTIGTSWKNTLMTSWMPGTTNKWLQVTAGTHQDWITQVRTNVVMKEAKI